MIELPIVGFAAIAEALRTSPRQALVWATRKVDPLRLRMYHGMPRILPSRLKGWQSRHLEIEGLRRVWGWNDIAKRVELSRMAAIRAGEAQEDPLPVARPKVGRVWAYESALDDWKEAHEWPYGVHRKIRLFGAKTAGKQVDPCVESANDKAAQAD